MATILPPKKRWSTDPQLVILFDLLSDGQPRSLKGLMSRFGANATAQMLSALDRLGEQEKRWRVLVDYDSGTVRLILGEIVSSGAIRKIAA